MNRIIIITIVISVVCVGMAAAGGPVNNYTNLKVLPRNISPEHLQRIMVDEFGGGLGVGCGFCHAEAAGSHRPDYASDAKPEKEIARRMLKMTLRINGQYFGQRRPMLGDQGVTVSCVTCHKGAPHPGEE